MRNMNKQCEIVQDLLPLYVDGACSQASTEMIEEHLKICSSCDQIYQQMCSHASENILKREKDGVIVRHERKERQKIIKYIFIALAIIYVPAVFLLAWLAGGDLGFITTPYLFDLLVVFLYTFPCYLALIELGLAVCRAIGQSRNTIGEKIFHAVRMILACSILITTTNLEKLLLASIAFAILLALTWLISAIVYKKKPNLKTVFRDKTFWICAVILLLAVGLIVSVAMAFLLTGSVREEPLEIGYSIGYRDSGSDYEGVYFDIGAEEQHSWDVIGKNPSFTVKWVNETDRAVAYDMRCYIYKKTGEGWGLCSTDYVSFPDTVYTLNAGEIKQQKYSIDGYEINENGRYRFVTFVDGKAVWVEFEVTVESHDILQ